jgi:hypothetical protein
MQLALSIDATVEYNRFLIIIFSWKFMKWQQLHRKRIAVEDCILNRKSLVRLVGKGVH